MSEYKVDKENRLVDPEGDVVAIRWDNGVTELWQSHLSDADIEALAKWSKEATKRKDDAE